MNAAAVEVPGFVRFEAAWKHRWFYRIAPLAGWPVSGFSDWADLATHGSVPSASGADGTIWAAGTADSEGSFLVPVHRPSGRTDSSLGSAPGTIRFASGSPENRLTLDRQGTRLRCRARPAPWPCYGLCTEAQPHAHRVVQAHRWHRRDTVFGNYRGAGGELNCLRVELFPRFSRSAHLRAARAAEATLVLLRLSGENGSVLYGTFLGDNAAPDITPMTWRLRSRRMPRAIYGLRAMPSDIHDGFPRLRRRREHGENTEVFVLQLKMPAPARSSSFRNNNPTSGKTARNWGTPHVGPGRELNDQS